VGSAFAVLTLQQGLKVLTWSLKYDGFSQESCCQEGCSVSLHDTVSTQCNSDAFDREEQWRTDILTQQQSLPFQDSATFEDPTRNMQSAASSTVNCEAVLPQPNSVTSYVRTDSTASWRSFQTCWQTQTFVRILTYQHIIINVAWTCSML
jgi:hypothetical protein